MELYGCCYVKDGVFIEWVDQVLHCVSSVSFSFLTNTFGGVYLFSSLQQGDPPSIPILICFKKVECRSLHGINVSRYSPYVSYLC